ncbi:MAG: biotin/lipoyl-binding carrier protein [Marmoricola sp.]
MTTSDQGVSTIDVVAPIVGNIWQLQVEIGDRIDAGETLMILESMKMEIPITAPRAGIVTTIPVDLAQIVQEGDVVATLAVD